MMDIPKDGKAKSVTGHTIEYYCWRVATDATRRLQARRSGLNVVLCSDRLFNYSCSTYVQFDDAWAKMERLG